MNIAGEASSRTSILNKMRSIKDLTPSERHIVDYIFSNLHEASNMGIMELGEKSFTSTTTVKRLCHKLGIDSYTDFRVRLSAEIENYVHINIIQGARTPVGKYDTVSDIVSKVSDQNAKSIIDTASINDSEVITAVIDLMKNASRIDFYGNGPSNVVAVDAQIKCMRLGIPCFAHENKTFMLIDAKTCEKGTLAFLISYTGETDDIIEVAECLNSRGINTVSLTSFSENHLSDICRYNLFVQSDESWDRLGGMSSRISTLSLIDILFTALINTDHEKYMRIMQQTNIPNHRGDSDGAE